MNKQYIRSIKKFLGPKAVNYNAYDLIAPLWQACAIYSAVIDGAWLHDDCPLDEAHQSQLNYQNILTLGIVLSALAYVIALLFRLAEKHYVLQPLKKYLLAIKSSQNPDGTLPQPPIHHSVLNFFDKFQYRSASALFEVVGILCFFAIDTIQQNKNGNWKNCGEFNPLKILLFLTVALNGLLTKSPLEQKKAKLKLRINTLLQINPKQAHIIVKAFSPKNSAHNLCDFIAPFWQALIIFFCARYGWWLHDGCPLVENISHSNYEAMQKTAFILASLSYFVSFTSRFAKKHYSLQKLEAHLDALTGRSQEQTQLISTTAPRHHRFINRFDTIQYRLSFGLLAVVASLCFYAITSIQENQGPDWQGCGKFNPVKYLLLSCAFIAGLMVESPLEIKQKELEVQIQDLTEQPRAFSAQN